MNPHFVRVNPKIDQLAGLTLNPMTIYQVCIVLPHLQHQSIAAEGTQVPLLNVLEWKSRKSPPNSRRFRLRHCNGGKRRARASSFLVKHSHANWFVRPDRRRRNVRPAPLGNLKPICHKTRERLGMACHDYATGWSRYCSTYTVKSKKRVTRFLSRELTYCASLPFWLADGISFLDR